MATKTDVSAVSSYEQKNQNKLMLAPQGPPPTPPQLTSIVNSDNIKLGGAVERGSFGVVRRARWLRALVAVKMLPSVKSSEIESFTREMMYATNLRHPNIVATMGAVVEPYFALVMELMEWGSLKASLNDLRRRKFFNFDGMLRTMLCVCRGGAYLSSVGVIHRDISSKNVFVSESFSNAKLGDFGYSKLLEDHIKDREDPEYGRRITDHIEIFAGAPAYKAPELLGDKPLYSEASDVFAFAIVCWEMLTTLWTGIYGRPWSDVATQKDLYHQIATGQRPRIDPEFFEVEEDIAKKHSSVIELIKKCWRQHPDDRPKFLNVHDFIIKFYGESQSQEKKIVIGTSLANEGERGTAGTALISTAPLTLTSQMVMSANPESVQRQASFSIPRAN